MPSERVSTVDTPCVRNCTLDASDTCLGCGRTLEEILGWHRLDAGARGIVLQQAALRLQERQR